MWRRPPNARGQQLTKRNDVWITDGRNNLVCDMEVGNVKPIAVIYWVDKKGQEKEKKCFTQSSLDRFTNIVRDGNHLAWTCMCSGDVSIPLRPPKRHTRAIM